MKRIVECRTKRDREWLRGVLHQVVHEQVELIGVCDYTLKPSLKTTMLEIHFKKVIQDGQEKD